MKYIKNGRIILPDGELTGKVLVFSGKIVDLIDENQIGQYGFGDVIDAEGDIVSPGLIDIHIHGYMGEDASDGSVEGLEKMSRELAKNGVTAFLPTTMTVSKQELESAFDSIRQLKDKEIGGACIIGVNAEGPYIAESRKGAQKADNILDPDAKFILENKDIIKITTVAPERDGAKEMIEEIKANSDIIVSIGHSDADFEQTKASFGYGVSHATHLFNAMNGLHHRKPGAVGAILSNDGVSCELIADMFHVDKGLYNLLYKAKANDLVLITDCTRAGGLPAGEYDLGGQKIIADDVVCRLEDGTVAGSILKLNKGVYNFRENTGLADWEVIKLASYNQAKILKDETRGSLEKGKRADITLFDDKYNVKRVFVGGKEIK